ncbi:site-specific integrase [Saccharopolyspora sp. ASAGF58]|uniref:tyrosine-type recombinase/integrase n=1 Tax=Saccharopolyspora sp. ASAGF58 TaxID=2719023 RepID=UPI001FF0BC65|nr:site-specific integrase [Saccharopolyspora sp. ASAGF58]
MGLPPGWVTDLPLPRTAQLHALGNGSGKGLVVVSAWMNRRPVGAAQGGYGPAFVVVARKAVVDHFFVSAAKVRRYFAPLAGIDVDGVAVVERAGALAEGTPFFVGPDMLPAEPLCSFFFEISKSLQPSTMADYASDLMDLVSFLRELDPPTDLLSATENDLIAYREACTLRGTRPLAPATWHRRRAAINNFYGWAVAAKLLAQRPYFRRPNGRDALSWGSALDLDVRCLTFDQWRCLKRVGLRGESPDGTADESFRGADPLRNSAAAELAVTTGMRLREFTSLLNIELPQPRPDGGPHRLRLQAIAKYQLPRDVLVQHPTVREIELYRRTERAAAVRRGAGALARRRDELFVVDEVDTDRMRLSGRLWGRRRTFAVHLLPPVLRRIAVIDGEHGLEPMALFVGRGGRMLSKQRWEQIFAAGFTRASHFAAGDGSVVMPRRFRIHDLRHTFAVLMLRELTRLVIERETKRREAGGHGGYLTEHIARNPLLKVQELLGHRQPSSTMRYLSYLDDTDELVAQAIAQWNAHDTTWADYAAVLTEQGVR